MQMRCATSQILRVAMFKPIDLTCMYPDDFLDRKLLERRQLNAYRILRLPLGIDFCSNDYLGIVRNNLLDSSKEFADGSTGSRLLTGNYPLIEEAETLLARFHDAAGALIFNSGYDANMGLLASVPQKQDTIVYDELSHASLRDGIRLSFARSFSFRHNDMDDLQKKLQQASGNVFVVTESVFSMDGDVCPLEHMVSICKQHGAHIIIDEAHAIGVMGQRGEGVAQQLNLHHECFARVYTFGKACGCHGAVVVGSSKLKEYLVNFARSFIFSTALPPAAVNAIVRSYAVFATLHEERRQLATLIQQFNSTSFSLEKIASQTPIQAVVVPGNDEVRRVALLLQQNNFDVRPIVYPTVPKGRERLRIILHAFNTTEQLKELTDLLSEIKI